MRAYVSDLAHDNSDGTASVTFDKDLLDIVDAKPGSILRFSIPHGASGHNGVVVS